MEELHGSFDEKIAYLKEQLRADENFDIIYRCFLIGNRSACVYFIDGLVKDEIMQKLLQYFGDTKPEDVPEDAYEMLKKHLPYIEVDKFTKVEDILKNILSGVPCLIIDGYKEVIAIDCRTYPARSVSEPEKDKAMRGSKDGFVETVVFNTALIRRRIRSPKLIMKMMEAGKSSKTDIVVCYMQDRVNQKLLDTITKKIESIQVDSLTMNQESLAECLYRQKWLNPFPKFKYSERPDTAAACILEGNIIILVDNSPSAMIVPASVFDIIEEADDYYFPPITGTYLRLSRFLINIVALILTPTFILLTDHPNWIPNGFEFIMTKEPMNIPLIWQFLILEFAIDGMKLASLNTPSMLSTPLSVVAGIVLGDFTVSSGWFSSEIMLYMAFITIANYSQANFELGYALKFMRMLCLITTGIFGVWGYVGGVVLVIFLVSWNKTISGKSYLYPLIPWNKRQFLHRFLRVSLPTSEKGQDFAK